MDFKLTKKNLTNTGLTKRQVNLLRASYTDVNAINCDFSNTEYVAMFCVTSELHNNYHGLLIVTGEEIGGREGNVCSLIESDRNEWLWKIDKTNFPFNECFFIHEYSVLTGLSGKQLPINKQMAQEIHSIYRDRGIVGTTVDALTDMEVEFE